MRIFDADRVNALVNDPSVRPHIGGTGELDLSAAVENHANHFFIGEHGGFAFIWSAPDTFEVHTFVLPEGRGGWAREWRRKAFLYMIHQNVTHLWTRVHPDARHVQKFTIEAGFTPAGTNTLDIGDGPVEWLLYNWRA